VRDRDDGGGWFGWAVVAIAALALAVRISYVLIARRDFEPGGDAFFYHAGANLLADGRGFISPFFARVGRDVPAAEHPPLYLMFLSVTSVLGMKSVLTHLLWSSLLGTGTVALVALLGRAVGGAWVGVLAGAIAAVYPNMWAPDGMLQAETLSTFLATLAVLLAYHYWRRPSWRRLVLVGAACGAGALARSELILMVLFLVVPLALTTRTIDVRRRFTWIGAAALAAVLLVAPWTIYNATRFEHPILLSAQFDPLLASANCDSTYYGRLQGYFDIRCATAIYERAGLTQNDDQSQEGIVYRRAAADYARDHLGRLPYVEAVRLSRIVGLYHPSFYVRMDSLIEGRDLWVSWAALWSFGALALLAIAGALLVRRARDVPLFPLLAPLATVVVTVLVTYASTRFRAIAEPMIVVLAAVTIDAGVRWMRRSRAGRAAA
jgi:hypothetical protein